MPILPINVRFNRETETKLQLIPQAALASFKAGGQQEADWHTLAARVNLGATLAHKHYEAGGDAHQAMNDAMEALRTSWDRFKRLGKMGMTGDEYNRIALAINLTDEMQMQCTRRELDEAMTEVFRQAAVYQ